MDAEEAVGRRIARARKLHGLTQLGLAGRAHLSKSLIAQVESGHKPATPSLIAAVASALNIDATDLTGQPYRGADARSDRIHAAIPLIRQALVYWDIPPILDVPPRPLADLSAETDRSAAPSRTPMPAAGAPTVDRTTCPGSRNRPAPRLRAATPAARSAHPLPVTVPGTAPAHKGGRWPRSPSGPPHRAAAATSPTPAPRPAARRSGHGDRRSPATTSAATRSRPARHHALCPTGGRRTASARRTRRGTPSRPTARSQETADRRARELPDRGAPPDRGFRDRQHPGRYVA